MWCDQQPQQYCTILSVNSLVLEIPLDFHWIKALGDLFLFGKYSLAEKIYSYRNKSQIWLCM